MTGITGGIVTGGDISEMADTLLHEPWYERDRFEDGNCGLEIVHHGNRDPSGTTTWEGNGVVGAIYGTITNGERIGLTTSTICERVLSDPESILPRLDGPFSIACYDAGDDRFVLATDKLGTRPCFYTNSSRFVFGTELKSVLSQLNEPHLDMQAVSDLLLMGNLWNERTLIEEVTSLPPAHVLQYEDGDVTLTRYWRCSYEEQTAGETYLFELANTYRDAIDAMAGTLDDSVGMWLSGGLDSRALVSELQRESASTSPFNRVTTYTYDGNPARGRNPEIADRIARRLEIENQAVELAPDRFLDTVDRSIHITDGMLRWSTFINLSSIFNISNLDTGVLLEAAGQGELLGEHIKRYHLTECRSAVESMYQSETSIDCETVADLLSVNIDPLQSFKDTVQNSPERSVEHQVLDAHFQNHYPRYVYASNQIARSQVGTRVPYAHGAFLEHVARLPLRYRMGTFPYTDGDIPYGISRPKLSLIRMLNQELAALPYERTGLAPSSPYLAHIAGFVGTTGKAVVRARLDGGNARGGPSMCGVWYRNHSGMREWIDELLDDACGREFFTADAIRHLQQRHLRGDADLIHPIASITTLESWIQNNLE